jgi:hypothetical protein
MSVLYMLFNDATVLGISSVDVKVINEYVAVDGMRISRGNGNTL